MSYTQHRTSHWAVKRLAAWSLEISEPWDIGLELSNHSKFDRCRDSSVTEAPDKLDIRSRTPNLMDLWPQYYRLVNTGSCFNIRWDVLS